MINRRDLLAAASAAAAFTPLAWARAQSGTPEGARLTAMLDVFFQEGLRHNPENATQRGRIFVRSAIVQVENINIPAILMAKTFRNV